MKLKTWEIALIAALIITFICGISLNREEKALSGKLIRLHVVANSDSEEDQALKLRVRDNVLELVSDELSGVSDRDTAAKRINEITPLIRLCAENTAEKNGYPYKVSVMLENEVFPTTDYDTFSLPSGEYLSLRVVIGEGAGHNWWCVVFPPLCTSGVLDDDTAAVIGLSDSEISLITAENEGYRIKFRSMELLQEIKQLLNGTFTQKKF